MKSSCYLLIVICGLFLCTGIHAQNWREVGPIPFPTNISGQIHGIGRVCQLKFHATNANRLYAVSASGGLWISNDGGSNWQRTGTDTQIPQGSSASVCIDYGNDNIIYLSTGDANYYGNGYGIYKSTDGGITWFASNTGIGTRMALEILMSPTDRNTLIAATTDGIWKTINGGATWAVKKVGGAFKDMVYRPGSSTILYAVNDNAFWRSADNGETWTQVNNVNPAPGNGGRLAVSAADPAVVYVGFIGSNDSRGGIIYKSTDNGLNFSLRKGDVTPNLTGYDAGSGGQGNYNFTFFADRFNANTLYVGAHCNWKSTDGGANWTKLTNWYEKCHTDMHHIVTSPYNNSRLFNANDGGVFLSTDGGSNWTPSANGLSATEVYHMGTSKLTTNIIGIGTQDNGELYYNGITWYCNRGGDWGSNYEFDYSNANTAYYIENATRKDLVANGGQSGIGLNNANNADIYALTALNTNLAFVGQGTALRRSTNLLTFAPTWTNIAALAGTVKAITVAPNNTNEVYVVTNDQRVYYSSNATTAAPTFTWISTLSNSTAISANLAVINSDPNIVYATAGARVYRSANKGTNWTDITGTLANINIIDLQHDKFSANESVYIATAKSVQYRNSTTANWQNISAGLPTIANITNIRLYNNAANNLLRVSFYGRGVWELPVNNSGGGGGTEPCLTAIPRTQYSVYQFDSQETVAESAPATNAIDGNPNTFWHSQYYNPTVPLPHSISINLGGTYNVTKLTYLPRQNSTNGRINAYQVHYSAEGLFWYLATSGSFTNSANAQDIVLNAPVKARYIRLTALSELTGNPFTTVAELTFYGCAIPDLCFTTYIPRANYSVKAFDSQELVGEYAPATNAIDGNVNTYWHSQWYNVTTPLPHYITIDLGATQNLSTINYVPRQNSTNGRIKDYKVEVSVLGDTWFKVAEGTWGNTLLTQTVSFPAIPARYVRLTATSEVNGYPWSTVGELEFYGCPGGAGAATTAAPLKSVKGNELVSYPVPTTGMVTIKVPPMRGRHISMEVSDLAGRVIKKLPVAGSNSTIQLNLGNVPNGQYILVVKDETGTSYSTKLVKQ